MTRRIISTLTLLLALSFVPVTASAQAAFGLSLSCPAVPLVMGTLESNHIGHSADDTELAKRVATSYARTIDATQVLLVQKEYDALEKRLAKLLKSVKSAECGDISKLHADHVKWRKDAEDFVRKELKKEFKFDKDLVLEFDLEKRKRPKNSKEQAELRRSLIQFQMANYVAAGSSIEEAKEKLVHRYELFTKRVEERDEQELYRLFLNAYATSLDPHSTYFSPDDVEDFRIQMELSLTGIGAVLSSRDGYTIVQEVVAGGAADQHGKLRPKDKIIAVAQGKAGEFVDIIDMSLRDVVKMIRGDKGTVVRLAILRPSSNNERQELQIVRDKIDLKEQAAKLKWSEEKRGEKTLKIATIELPSFYGGQGGDARDSYQDVKKLVAEAKKGNADGMVLDLSRNGGGVLNSAIKISGLFIERGPIVGVGSKLKAKSTPADVLEDRDPRVQWDGPLVVLTSSVSASASEILAGALQDYGRAVVVGDKHTFGKGSVQQMTQLPPGLGMVKVTTALFFLPGGKSTQNIGVLSDIQIPSFFAELDIGERHQDYALEPVDIKAFATAQANASKSWKPVKKSTIKKLAAASKKRVAASEEFKEFAKDLKDRNANETKVKIADILKDSNSADDEDEEEDTTAIQVKEAVQIAADLVVELS